jgi:hypothetical protein
VIAEPSIPDKTRLLLSEQSRLCVACLSAKSGSPVGDVMVTLKLLAETMSGERDIAGRCEACKRLTLVYSLSGKPQK